MKRKFSIIEYHHSAYGGFEAPNERDPWSQVGLEKSAPKPPDSPFTVRDLANRWSCSEEHVRQLCRDGSLACFRIGTRFRIPLATILTFEGVPQPDQEKRGWEKGLERVRQAASR